MRIVLVVTHLLGTGHLARALTLGRAMVARGHEAHVISGGRPVPHLPLEGVTLHQLPPVASDGTNFTRLLTEDNSPADDGFLARRRAMAVDLLRDLSPDVLITELYPFGRRVLKPEFLALLNAARSLQPRPVIHASIRDILAPPSRPAKAQETEAILAAFYDGVLVHSDPALTPLSASWPVTPSLKDKLIYTGFVAPRPPLPHPDRAGAGEILVTAGGGDVGMPLFETAIAAAAAGDATRRWRILVGGSDREADCKRLQSTAPAHVTVEPARPDFRQMLRHADACLSMCGYNTAMDLLQTGCPAVLVPFDAGGETEQTLRARSLAESPQFELIATAALTPGALTAALDRLIAGGRHASAARMDGADRTVTLLETRR